MIIYALLETKASAGPGMLSINSQLAHKWQYPKWTCFGKPLLTTIYLEQLIQHLYEKWLRPWCTKKNLTKKRIGCCYEQRCPNGWKKMYFLLEKKKSVAATGSFVRSVIREEELETEATISNEELLELFPDSINIASAWQKMKENSSLQVIKKSNWEIR